MRKCAVHARMCVVCFAHEKERQLETAENSSWPGSDRSGTVYMGKVFFTGSFLPF